MKKLKVIIVVALIFSAGVASGIKANSFYLEEEHRSLPGANTISQQSAIRILEYCRDNHAILARNNTQIEWLNNVGFTGESISNQEEWVRIYDDLIRYVKSNSG